MIRPPPRSTHVPSSTLCRSGGVSGNYSFAYVDATLSITKALLTVTAHDKTREHRLANPNFTHTSTAYRLGHDESALTTAPGCSAPATQSSDVGSYTISCSGS